MTRTNRGGPGWEINQVVAYDTVNTSGTFDTVSSPTPSQGTYLLHATGTTSSKRSPVNIDGGLSATFRWCCARDWFRLAGTLNVAQEVEFFSLRFRGSTGDIGLNLRFFWVYDSASTYTIRIKSGTGTTLDTTTTTYAVDTFRTLRVQSSGSLVKVWIDGTLEFEIVDTAQLEGWNTANYLQFINTTLAASQDMYWGPVVFSESNSEADRPGTAIRRYKIVPAGNDKTDEYGSHTSGSDASGDYTWWDDWTGAGTANDDTDYNQEQGGAVGKEISTLSTVAISAFDNINTAAAVLWRRSRTNVAAKTVDVYSIIRDDAATPNELESLGPNIATTNYASNSAAFPSPPSGTWSDYVASNTFNHASSTKKLRAGTRSPDTNGSNDIHTALAIELLTIDDDAPATTAEPRHRAKGQVV